MPRPVQVRTGAIGPEPDVRDTPSQDLLTQRAEQARASRPAAPEEVVLNSKYRNYIFQITSPAPIFDPASGRVLDVRPKAAKFQNGEYRTRDAEVIAVMKADRGYGVDFWDAGELAARAAREAEARFEAQLVEKLKSDPTLLTRLAPTVESFAPQPQP
jgi:hypothetical protein